MRNSAVFAALMLSCALECAFAQTPAPVAPSCADLQLVPEPRECIAVRVMALGGCLEISADKNEEDQFSANDLRQVVKQRFGSSSCSIAGMAPSIRLLRHEGSDVAGELLARNYLKFVSAMHDEGYVIVPNAPNGMAVIAETSAGLFYGAQTVKQLIRSSGKNTELLIPTIRDWPAMAHRGLSDDWSRGPIPTMDFLKREISTLAAYKINTFSPYFESTFAYRSTPLTAFPGGAMTPEEARELVAVAARYHITVIPEQEAFGHLHHLLKFEQYSQLSETPHGSVLAPGATNTLPLIDSWFGELAKVFPAPYVHIGADETFELGMGQTHDAVQQQGLGAVYIDFLKQIHTTLAPNHKRLLFWGDIAVKSPELVATLPKDMIAVAWRYSIMPDYTPLIEPFAKAGLETWVAPSVRNVERVYPNYVQALGNIRAFVRDGQKAGSTGVLNTTWNDDGEGIFDEDWFGVLFGAAAGWHAGESSEETFTASYGMAFHHDTSGKVSRAQRELMACQNLFYQAGLIDAQDRYFWVDPFTPVGRAFAAQLRPVEHDLRVHAERAITLVEEARSAEKLDNQEALDTLELGARRIDFIGLKFQLADQIAANYAKAYALKGDESRKGDVAELLEEIGSDNGWADDVRDGYSLLRGLYEQAWLRDNRPYWLRNNLNHYDAAAQLWIGRSDRWRQVMYQWQDEHTLPTPAELGLPEAK